MRILYFGDGAPRSTSRHRADALARLGHEVIIKSPTKALSSWFSGRILPSVHHHTGYRLVRAPMRAWIRRLMAEMALAPPDIVWVNGGETFDLASIKLLKGFGKPVVLYTNDDPTGKRDGRRFDTLLTAVAGYDLIAVVRKPSVEEFLQRGAQAVELVWRSYDEVAHRPFDRLEDIPPEFRSEVAFIGTCIPGENRDRFLVDLIDRGVNVAIWGNNWDEARLWPQLRPHFRGKAIYCRDYVAAVQGASISLGLLSKGNRDLHTTRSLEVPYIGGLLCAERTVEHEELYQEGVEALFWDNAEECASRCHGILKDGAALAAIRAAGQLRVRQGKFGNEDICRQILEKLVGAR